MRKLREGILVLLVIAAVSITFTGRYEVLLREFENEAHEKEIQINRYIEISRTFIELMTIYGNEFFQQHDNINTELYSLFKYDPRTNSFDLDAAAGTKYEKAAGNLTGIGELPEKGINLDELSLALKYNEFFNDFYERLEGVQWLYYISENDFINLYPWVPSTVFAYYEGIKNRGFYSYVDPDNNPQRDAIWVPEYRDHAGKRMVVTLSSPIYNKGIFMGVICLNISKEKLSEIISTEYESCLIDAKNSIIATGSGMRPDNSPGNFSTLFESRSMNAEGAINMEKNAVRMLGDYYFYSVGFDKVPWSLYFMVPIYLIVYKAAVTTLPILITGVLLIFLLYEYEKQKITEQLLQNSLEELKSYQKLLENAAKLDMLTNTYNRRGFKESFRKRIKQTYPSRAPISFIIGDIDHFKQFNDTFGHAAGDKVLIDLTNTIRKGIGSEDIICRWGGEEFVIVLFGRNYQEAMAAAEKIREDVEALAIPWESTAVLKATMTFGVAEYNYTDSIDQVVSKADSALYIGKENKRNQVNGYIDSETG